MADDLQRPKLQPRAEVIRTFLPSVNTGARGLRIADLPDQLRELSGILGRDVAGQLAAEEGQDIREAARFLQANPNATEEELVEMMGGHRTVARKMLRENDGRLEAEQFSHNIRRKLLESPVRRQGPEAVREFYSAEVEGFFDTLPDDENIRAGARDALVDMAERLIGDSVQNETANIIQTQEEHLATTVRNGLVLDGADATVAKVREMSAIGEVAGIPPQQQRAAIIDSFIEHATTRENLFEGEDVLQALVDGEDPLIKDPQDRNRVASAIREVRRLQYDQQKIRDEEAEDAKEREAARATMNLFAQIAADEKINPEDFSVLANIVGPEDAAKTLDTLKSKAGVVQSLFHVSPEQEAQARYQVATRAMDTRDILALDWPNDLTLDLIETAQTGVPDTIRGTTSYRAGIAQIKAHFSNPVTGVLLGEQAAAAMRAFDNLAVKLQLEDETIIQPANVGRLTGRIDEIAQTVIQSSEQGVTETAAGIAGERLETQVGGTEAGQRAFVKMNRRQIVDILAPPPRRFDPIDAGVSATLLPHQLGADPIMESFWTEEGDFLDIILQDEE